MTQYQIKVTAPTVYQAKSIAAFGIEVKKSGNGSLYACQDFATKQQAIDYLITRASMYYDESEEEQNKAIEDIKRYDSLTIDAATAHIEEREGEWEQA